MAQPPSPSNTATTTPSDLDPSAPPPPPAPPAAHDWEVLSLSMSSSAFGTPGSASVVCGCDACTGRDTGDSIPHSVSFPVPHESGSSEFPPSGLVKQTGSGVLAGDVEDTPIEGKGDPKRLQSDQPDSGVIATGTGFQGPGSSDVGIDDGEIAMVSTSGIEPFIEGWKPHLGAAEGTIPDRSSSGGFRDYVASEQIPLPEDYHEVICAIDEDTEPLILQEEMFIAGAGAVFTEGIAEARSLTGVDSVDDENLPKNKARKAQANGTWWKRQVYLWRAQSRKSNAVWSVALAAAVLGIVIIGHRWQRERQQAQQLRLELCAKDEKLNDLMYQVTRLKEVITGRRRVPVMRSSSFSRFSEY